MKNVCCLFVLMLIMTNCANSQTQQKNGIFNVDAKEFKLKVDAGKGTVLDVRTQEEKDKGYIKGAVLIDYYRDDFEAQIQKLDKTKEVYVYCHAGGRGQSAAKLLQKHGFMKVYNLEDGIVGWKENGFPLVQ